VVGHELRADLMLEALAINAGLITAGGAAFLALVDSARRAGALLAMGE
jgi:ABC-2 type transport system permease protein